MPKITAANVIDSATQKNIDSWLLGSYDEETKNQIRQMIERNPQEAVDAFFTHLEFGTGGLRGIMGVGCNRVNFYTIKTATQGLANYINSKTNTGSVFISFDSRHHSEEFAKEAAKVLAANNIQVYITKELRPTPLVSFGCRYYKCTAAIMITASHNPREYNGYKVYWDDGGQVLPPNDTGIIEEVNKITDLSQIKEVVSFSNPLITVVEEEVDNAYLDSIATLQVHRQTNLNQGKELSIVYTSLHGTGITLVPKALKQSGFSQISYVDEQIIPDGNFPTAPYPNPEERKALALGIETLEKIHGDILIATDPDADRMGVAVSHHGKVELLTGNQIACLCVDFICRILKEKGKLPIKAAFVKSIVTSELFDAICKSYKKFCFNVLTGFKYIAEKIRDWEVADNQSYTFIFGAEESYGYLLGTFARDKDAVVSAVLISELALWCKLKGITLIDQLHELYRKHGIYYQKLHSLNFVDSKEGKDKMAAGMKLLRENTPREICGESIIKIEDYQLGTDVTLEPETCKKTSKPLPFPKSNVIVLILRDGSKLTVRPSGTEPKVKIYCEVIIHQFLDVQKGLKEAETKAKAMIEGLQKNLD